MSAEEDVYTWLTNSTDVTDIVGSDIYGTVAVEVVPPYIQFHGVFVDPLSDLANTHAVDLVHVRVEYTAQDYSQLLALGAAIRQALATSTSTLFAYSQSGTIKDSVYQGNLIYRVLQRETLGGS